MDACGLYLHLLKRCLTDLIYGDREPGFDLHKREEGKDWPKSAHTMIGLKRLDNVQACVESVIDDAVPGDLVETGVWRGGAVILMRAVLKAHGITDRTVWAADSFEGLPVPDARTYPVDEGDPHHTYKHLAVGLEEVQRNFKLYGLLDGQVRFLKGWFRDTLPKAPVERLAVLRLDCDMYGSTTEALENLYPKLSPGGYLIVDDWHLERARKAVEDYRTKASIKDPIVPVDWAAVYWRKS